MATTILNATFDGVNPVTTLSGTTNWNSGFLGYYSQFESNPADTLQANISLTGSNWTVAAMRFGDAAGANTTNITDLNANGGRRIDFIKLGQNSDVDLLSTRVRFMYGDDGASHDITLGSGEVDAIQLGGDTNTLVTGSAFLGSFNTWRGVADVTINSGGGRSVETDDGNDIVTVDTGSLHYLNTAHGNDTINVLNGGRINSLRDWGGTDTVTLSGGSRIEQLFLHGDNTIDIQDSSRIFQQKWDSGTTTLTTGTGWTESITGFDVSSNITIGSGGMGQLRFDSNTMQTHDITTNGYVGSLSISDSGGTTADDQTADLTINDNAGAIQLGGGNDTITTGNGFVDFIHTGRGDDEISVGAGGALSLYSGRGNDVIKVSALSDPNNGFSVYGGADVDTLDFSGIVGTKIFFRLDGAGAFYNVGAKNGDLNAPAVIGYFSETRVENLIGTDENDKFLGDGLDNRLTSLGGNDQLFGQKGTDILEGGHGKDRLYGGDDKDFLFGGTSRDTLEGGAGDDVLRGQKGADKFVFRADAGNDQVRDYQHGLDRLQIADHVGGFGSLVIADNGANREITHDGGLIILTGQAGLVLTAGDFDFI